MIDTHCHLDSSRFEEDRAHVLARAFEAGVSSVVIPAVGPDSWEALLRWPTSDARVQVGLGIHPQLLPQLPESEDEASLERLDALLARGGAIAVGECGLDGGSIPGAPLERQIKVLRAHFRLARKHQLPVLLHCLHAHPALVDLFKEERPPERTLLHSYSGAEHLARFYAEQGCSFSFAGPVTYPGARKPIQALRAIPLDRLMVETDAPDQAPHPHRGQRSEPGYLPLIVEAMSRALEMPREELAQRTTENALRFFPGVFVSR